MSACLDEDQIRAFAFHELPAETRGHCERHFDDCSRCFDVLAAIVHKEMATAPGLSDTIRVTPSPRPRPRRPAPRHLGRYQLLELLGKGGMGAVYRAFDPALQRHVALKILHDDASSTALVTTLRSRLLDEAHAMARLTHPNVVTVYDVGFVDQQIFVAMELVDGETLQAWQKGQAHSWRAIVARYLLAAEGLRAAHASGLVHRDFKPENVLVSGARVLVTDFGLACSGAGLPSSSSPDPVGTPAYMAPEQFRGDAVDARTDIFSFCAALYEAVYHASAFAGDDAKSRRAAVLAGRMRATPRDAHVPRWLRTILLRGLAAQAAARPASIEEVIGQLRRGLRARQRSVLWTAAGTALVLILALSLVLAPRSPLTACRRRAQALQRSWSARRRQLLAATFARSGLPFAPVAWRNTERMLSCYVDQFTGAFDNACQAIHRNEAQSREWLERRMRCLEDARTTFERLVGTFDEGDPVAITNAVSAASRLDGVATCAAVGLLNQPLPLPHDEAARGDLDRASAALAGARALELTGKYDAAKTIATATLATARARAYAPLEADAALLLGIIARDQGQWRAAELADTDSLDAAERGRADLVRARAMSELVLVVGHRQGRIAEGQRWAQFAEGVLARLDRPPLEVAELALRRGLLQLSAGRLDDAEAELHESLRIYERTVPAADTRVAIVWIDLAAVMLAKGRYDDMEAAYRRAWALQRDALGAEHPLTLAAKLGIGVALFERGQARQALGVYDEVFAPLLAALGPKHPNVAAALTNIANACDVLGQEDRAVRYGERAIAIVSETAPDTPILAQLEINLGTYLRHSLDQLERAHRLTASSLERRRHLFGAASPLVGEAEYHQSLIFIVERRWSEALTHARLALPLIERGYGARHPRLADVLDALGVIDREQGRAAEAVAKHRRALSIRDAGDNHERATTLTHLGLAELALGHAAAARRSLEAALRLSDSVDRRPTDRAQTALALARAIAMSDGFGERARALAHEAAAVFDRAAPGFASQAAEARRWLRGQQGATQKGER
jgi:tetratricopeptide (TPR) repeat protein